MAEKIIATKTLPSGITAICAETIKDNFSIEIAANCLFLHSEDIPDFISLLHDIDRHFLGKA